MPGRMAVGFVDLEKAYDTATVRWMEVPEAEARMVEAMYDRTKGRVVVGSRLSEEFSVNIGLRQGSVHGDGTNQQEDQHKGCSQEDDVCSRSGQNSRTQTKTTGSVGGMEGGVQEVRTEN